MTDNEKNKTTVSSAIRHPSSDSERIAKRMARAGLCSRREAESWIEEGRVKVNGKQIKSPALNVTASDSIVVDGKLIGETEAARLFLYHKPPGLMTTHKDPQGRPTVFERLPKELPRVISVGRLDMNSEGLLLLTTDGSLARKLELPSNGWIRRYRVRVYGGITESMISEMKAGVKIDGVQYGSVETALDSQKGNNSWMTVALTEGKNREIRRIFEYYGLQVSRLLRVSYGPFQLGALPKGQVKEVTGKVIKSFIGKN